MFRIVKNRFLKHQSSPASGPLAVRAAVVRKRACRILACAAIASFSLAFPARAALSPQAELGHSLFFDPILSGSQKMSCASCHDPANHYAPSNTLAVQTGGRNLDQPGIRAVPTLTYKDEVPNFSLTLENPDGSQSAPGGGHDWDGRERDVAAQSLVPLLQTFEMANLSVDDVVTKIEHSPLYRERFQTVFGKRVFDHPRDAFIAVGAALQAYQHEDPSFHPYTSKYDYYTRGLAVLTPAEQRGMALFNDAERANCAACHTAGQGPGRDGGLSAGQFTDFFFRALGVPRNSTIDYSRFGGFDLGLCGPLRRDLMPQTGGENSAYCGLFMTPTLRNVATRKVFFHNGRFTSLRDAVEFYFTRDTDPAHWYGAVGSSSPYDDLPERYRSNVDHDDRPFTQQKPGGKSALSEAEIDDIVVFLKTLTDGYDVRHHRY